MLSCDSRQTDTFPPPPKFTAHSHGELNVISPLEMINMLMWLEIHRISGVRSQPASCVTKLAHTMEAVVMAGKSGGAEARCTLNMEVAYKYPESSLY